METVYNGSACFPAKKKVPADYSYFPILLVGEERNKRGRKRPRSGAGGGAEQSKQPGAGPSESKGIHLNTHYFFPKKFLDIVFLKCINKK